MFLNMRFLCPRAAFHQRLPARASALPAKDEELHRPRRPVSRDPGFVFGALPRPPSPWDMHETPGLTGTPHPGEPPFSLPSSDRPPQPPWSPQMTCIHHGDHLDPILTAELGARISRRALRGRRGQSAGTATRGEGLPSPAHWVPFLPVRAGHCLQVPSNPWPCLDFTEPWGADRIRTTLLSCR